MIIKTVLLSLQATHFFVGILELRTIVVVVTTGAIKRAKLQSNHYHQQTYAVVGLMLNEYDCVSVDCTFVSGRIFLTVLASCRHISTICHRRSGTRWTSTASSTSTRCSSSSTTWRSVLPTCSSLLCSRPVWALVLKE